jgi:hypothetical protein
MRSRRSSRPRRTAGDALSKLTGWRRPTPGSVPASTRWPASRARKLRSVTGQPRPDTRGRHTRRPPSSPTSCSPGPAAAVPARCGRVLMLRSRRSTVPVVEPTWSRWRRRTNWSPRLRARSLSRLSVRTAPAGYCLAGNASARNAARVKGGGQARVGGTSRRRCPARFHISPRSLEPSAPASSLSLAACSIIA